MVIVPMHGSKPVTKGALRDVIRQAGLTVDDFTKR